MTFQQFYLVVLGVSLMTTWLALGQETNSEDLIEMYSTVTEVFTESTPAQPEMDNTFLTCDFDLDNIEQLLQYLPDICTEIYNERFNDSSLYDLHLEESKSFAKFYKKLDDYELRDQVLGDKVELAHYPFETKLRNETYSQVDWAQCVTVANGSSADYLSCLKVKHLELAELIPDVNGK